MPCSYFRGKSLVERDHACFRFPSQLSLVHAILDVTPQQVQASEPQYDLVLAISAHLEPVLERPESYTVPGSPSVISRACSSCGSRAVRNAT
jgi:hypothetical protein